jgi:hypothetical protein
MDKTEVRRHFVESLYETLDGIVSPTPYVEITEGERVDIRFLNGKGRLPAEGSTEVTVLDINVASLFFDDFNILYEGVTGTGKTYTSDALFHAVFGEDGHYTIRLGGGLLGMSALEPFTKTVLDEGVPKAHIDHPKCERYGGLFIDEINRGDTQEVFQVVDGEIHINGDTGRLRLPIQVTDRYKKLAIIAAMNPSDAQHSSALELDLAGENRFLKFRFPNGADEAGTSQTDKKKYDERLGAEFWDKVRARTGLEGDWRALYPVITDPEQIDTELHGDAREFIDVALAYVGKDPLGTFDRNRELMESGGYKPRFAVAEGNDLERVREAQKLLKHGFVRRDLPKVKNMANLLAFVKSVKDGTYDPSVSLYDVAASMGIVLESKKVTGSDEGRLMTLVNDALHSYHGIRGSMGVPEGYGTRQAVWQAAINAGQGGGFEPYLNTIRKSIKAMNTQTRGTSDATLRSRLVADLAVLDHFSRAHQDGIEGALKQDGDASFVAFREVYENNKKKASVYEHRLSSLMR